MGSTQDYSGYRVDRERKCLVWSPHYHVLGFSKDDFDEEPDVENSYGSYGDFELVGKGKVTNEFCGKFYGYVGCARVELHNTKIFVRYKNKVSLQNCTGKVYVRKVFNSCDKPSCPVCFKYGWAVRQARSIEARLKEASKRFGLAEHIVASVPSKDYGLSLEKLRLKVVKILRKRGVVGGCLIFHGFRYNNVRLWYWSPHFHVLGVIKGGYGCRNCNHERGDCRSCSGFNGREVRGFEKDGYIVKVMGERKTVFGTAWYQLNHSTIRTNVKRFHVATWFGVCSYRKLKVKVEKKKSLCPICGEELVKLHYLGLRHIVRDRDSPDFVGSFVDDLVGSDGSLNWCEASSGSYG